MRKMLQGMGDVIEPSSYIRPLRVSGVGLLQLKQLLILVCRGRLRYTASKVCSTCVLSQMRGSGLIFRMQMLRLGSLAL